MHIGEEVEHGVVIHKDCLHRDLARRHDEGVLSAVLVGQFERLAVLVQHGQAFEGVACRGLAVMVTVSPLEADSGDTVTVPCS